MIDVIWMKEEGWRSRRTGGAEGDCKLYRHRYIHRTHLLPPTTTPGALCGSRLLPGPTDIVAGGAALDAMTKDLFNWSSRYGRAVVGYCSAMTSFGATHTGECEEFEECWGLEVEPYHWPERLGGDKRNACHVLNIAALPLRVSSDPRVFAKSLRRLLIGRKRRTDFVGIPIFNGCC